MSIVYLLPLSIQFVLPLASLPVVLIEFMLTSACLVCCRILLLVCSLVSYHRFHNFSLGTYSDSKYRVLITTIRRNTMGSNSSHSDDFCLAPIARVNLASSRQQLCNSALQPSAPHQVHFLRP